MSETPLRLEPDDRPPPPRWPGEIVVEAEYEDLFDNLATELMMSAIEAVRTRGVFHLAVTADESVQPLLDRFILDPGLRRMPWPKSHLWQADAPCTVQGESAAAWARISSTLVPHAGLARGHSHPMPVNDESGPEHYTNRLDRVLNGSKLDHVVVCCGADGHIGGLQQGDAVTQDRVVFARRNDLDIMTMTPRAIGGARRTILLVFDAPTRHCIDRGFVQETAPIHRLMRAGAAPMWGIVSEALA